MVQNYELRARKQFTQLGFMEKQCQSKNVDLLKYYSQNRFFSHIELLELKSYWFMIFDKGKMTRVDCRSYCTGEHANKTFWRVR